MSSIGTFVDGDGASVTVTDITVRADSVVPSGLVDTLGELVTSVGTIIAFVNFWVTFFAITIETIVTDTGVSADLGTIGCFFFVTQGASK